MSLPASELLYVERADNTRSTPMLLMRELVAPWTHFFEPIAQEEGLRSMPGKLNTELSRDMIAARGDEPYAGVTADQLRPASTSLLQFLVGGTQPLVFSSQQILNERWPRQPDGTFPAEPVPGSRWENVFAAFKRGEWLALPYVDQRATDPDKLAQHCAAYAAYRTGELHPIELSLGRLWFEA